MNTEKHTTRTTLIASKNYRSYPANDDVQTCLACGAVLRQTDRDIPRLVEASMHMDCYLKRLYEEMVNGPSSANA